MNHDSERLASSYVTGLLSRRRRKSFEEHLLGCEECWREVESARHGRAVVESAREVTPQHVRESIRSTVAAIEPPRRPFPLRRLGLSLAVLLALSIGGFALLTQNQPDEIDLALAHFAGSSELGPEISSDMPENVDGMELVGSQAGMMGDLEVTAHTYSDAVGHTIVLYQADGEWPEARGAEYLEGSPSWKVDVNGTVVFCSNRTVPSLVLGDAEADVMRVADALDLR